MFRTSIVRRLPPLSRLFGTSAASNPSVPHGFSPLRFEDLEYLRTDLKSRLAELGFTHLTKAQETALPIVFANPQSFVLAETGSGKTLIYLLPLINALFNE